MSHVCTQKDSTYLALLLFYFRVKALRKDVTAKCVCLHNIVYVRTVYSIYKFKCVIKCTEVHLEEEHMSRKKSGLAGI